MPFPSTSSSPPATRSATGQNVASQPPMEPGDEAPEGAPGTGENLCPRCNGSGKDGGGDCPECGGTGKVTTGIGGG